MVAENELKDTGATIQVRETMSRWRTIVVALLIIPIFMACMGIVAGIFAAHFSLGVTLLLVLLTFILLPASVMLAVLWTTPKIAVTPLLVVDERIPVKKDEEMLEAAQKFLHTYQHGLLGYLVPTLGKWLDSRSGPQSKFILCKEGVVSRGPLQRWDSFRSFSADIVKKQFTLRKPWRVYISLFSSDHFSDVTLIGYSQSILASHRFARKNSVSNC